MQIADCVRPRQLTTSHRWHVADVNHETIRPSFRPSCSRSFGRQVAHKLKTDFCSQHRLQIVS
eukprot:6630452-Prymnesium_polylepis.1